MPCTAALAKTSWLIVIFGDSGSLQHNCDERVAGDTLENPYEAMEKQRFLS
jgi:hypothetical protein